MLATNQMFLVVCGLLLFVAGFVWLAPKPKAAGGPPAGGH
jgi:hypothetical protein